MESKIKNLYKKFIIVFLTILLIIFIVLLFLEIKSYEYKNKKIELSYPSIFLKDNKNNNYIVDNASRRLIKTDINNKLLYIIEANKKKHDSNFQILDIAVDNNENLFMLTTFMDEKGFYVNKVSLQKYDKSGRLDGIIYEKVYTPEELSNVNVQRSLIKNLFYKNNMIYFFSLEKNWVRKFEYNIQNRNLKNSVAFLFDNTQYFISNIYLHKDEEYFVTSKNGEIYKIFENKKELISKYTESIPYSLNYINDRLIFSDLLKKNIYFIKDSQISTLFDNQNKNHEQLLNYYYNIKVYQDSILLTSEASVLQVNEKGDILFITDNVSNKPENILKYYSLIVILLILTIFIVILFRKIYTEVLGRRISIFIKQLIVFIPLVIISITITTILVYQDLNNRYESLLNDKIANMIQIISRSLDFQDIKNLNNPSDFMSQSYLNLKEKIMYLLNYNRDSWNNDFYFTLHKKIGNEIFTVMFLNDDATVKTPFPYLNEENSIYIRSYEGQILLEKSIDQWGNWFYGVGPIFDDNNNVVGLIEIGKDNTAFEIQNQKLIQRILTNVIILILISVLIVFLVLYYILVSLRKLKDGTQLIEKGIWEIKVKIETRDEIEDLAFSFNKMVEHINKYLNEITDLNKVYFKFVPEEFLKFLNKKNIVDIKLGDQVQKEMTIMFQDIVGFTKISEKLTPEENFNFLNSYLSVIGPIIRKHNGFIDKYIGDGIMALFPNQVDEAINAAIEIERTIIEFNKEIKSKNFPDIDVRVGLHKGPLMLGILGEEQRVDSTVISDNVNLASRLEGLNRKFGSSIIISEEVFNDIRNKDSYLYRYLGRVKVKGKENEVKIYEILDGLKNEDKIKRIKSLNIFKQAIDYFEKTEYKSALEVLNKLYQYDNDKAILFYKEICEYYIKENKKESSIVLYDK